MHSLMHSLSLAHVVLVWMNLLLDWDLDGAMREVRRAVELGPSDTAPRLLYSTLLCFAGRHSDAIAELEYALKLNPTSLHPNQ